eukprot:828763-Pyramimonas_sp.AAC.1
MSPKRRLRVEVGNHLKVSKAELSRILEEASRDNHEPDVLPLETPLGHLIDCFALTMKDGSE